MRGKISRVGILWRLIVALTIALCSVLANSNSATALSLGDYFSFSYSVEFSKTQIVGSEVFYATVEVTANCIEDLPWPYSLASEASITGRIIAEQQTSGAKVTLSSEYTVPIKPFPSTKGETTPVSQVIPLQFPQGSQSGTYRVVAELIEAKVKAILIWKTVTEYLPSAQTAGSVTYISSSGGAVGGGGGGISQRGEAPLPGTNDVSGFISTDGTFNETVVAESFDSRCELIINKGTKGLNQEGERLTNITMTKMEDWLAPPGNSSIISVIYDLGPDGATFDPPITLTITYDESLIPEGVAEENLVIAMWDETASEWIMLTDCTVNPETNTIAAPVGHFTAFTVLTYTLPATFVASELSITPTEVAIGEEITITTLISNTGELAGSHKVTLNIDNVVVATKEVTLEGGASEEITFTVAKHAAGTYTVSVNGLSDTFTVKPVGALIPAPPKTINWGLVGGIIVAVVLLSLGSYFLVRKRGEA